MPDDARVEVKPMFGNLGAFVNGNMFIGLFGTDVGVKLTDADQTRLSDAGGGPFGPPERPMGGYVTLPAAMTSAEAKRWVARSARVRWRHAGKEAEAGKKNVAACSCARGPRDRIVQGATVLMFERSRPAASMPLLPTIGVEGCAKLVSDLICQAGQHTSLTPATPRRRLPPDKHLSSGYRRRTTPGTCAHPRQLSCGLPGGSSAIPPVGTPSPVSTPLMVRTGATSPLAPAA